MGFNGILLGCNAREYGLNKLYGELMTLKPMKYHLTME